MNNLVAHGGMTKLLIPTGKYAMDGKLFARIILILVAVFISSGCATAEYKFETICWGYGYTDGRGREAKFDHPHGIVVDRRGNLYVADRRNWRIRKITPDREVTTFAGSEGSRGHRFYRDGPREEAVFLNPKGLALDEEGNLYVSDQHAIRKIVMDAENGDYVITVAGIPDKAGYADGKGSEARFGYPMGLAMEPDGNLLVADQRGMVRRVTPEGEVSTVAGIPRDLPPQMEPPVDGPADEVVLGLIQDLCVAPDGTIYFTQTAPSAVRKIDVEGNVSTLVGKTKGRRNSRGICLDADGNLFVANSTKRSVSRITPEGEEETLGGYRYDHAFVIVRSGRDSGPFRKARFHSPRGITIDDNGVLYITDDGEHSIRIGRPRK